MTRTHVLIVAGLLIAGCERDEGEVRRIVQDELSKGLQRQASVSDEEVGPYSNGMRIGGFFFASGQIGLDSTTGELKNDNFEGETRQALANVFRVLGRNGYDSTHVVSVTVYLKNMNDYTTMNLIYGGYFEEGNYPARTTVEVSNLPKQANIEITVIAYKPPRDGDTEI